MLELTTLLALPRLLRGALSRRVPCRHILAIHAYDQIRNRPVDIRRLMWFGWRQYDVNTAFQLRRNLAFAPPWMPPTAAPSSTTETRADTIRGIVAEARYAAELCAHDRELVRELRAGLKAAVNRAARKSGPSANVQPNPATRKQARADARGGVRARCGGINEEKICRGGRGAGGHHDPAAAGSARPGP